MKILSSPILKEILDNPTGEVTAFVTGGVFLATPTWMLDLLSAGASILKWGTGILIFFYYFGKCALMLQRWKEGQKKSNGDPE